MTVVETSDHISYDVKISKRRKMQAEEIKQLIESHMTDSKVSVVGDDGYHFEALIIAPAFEGLSLLARQRMIYATLGDRMQTGLIHALSIKTFTPTEWDQKS